MVPIKNTEKHFVTSALLSDSRRNSPPGFNEGPSDLWHRCCLCSVLGFCAFSIRTEPEPLLQLQCNLSVTTATGFLHDSACFCNENHYFVDIVLSWTTLTLFQCRIYKNQLYKPARIRHDPTNNCQLLMKFILRSLGCCVTKNPETIRTNKLYIVSWLDVI